MSKINIDKTIDLVIKTVAPDREEQEKIVNIVDLIVAIEKYLIGKNYFDDSGSARIGVDKVFWPLFGVENIDFVSIGELVHGYYERIGEIKYTEYFTDLVVIKVHKTKVEQIEAILPCNADLVLNAKKAKKQLKNICRKSEEYRRVLDEIEKYNEESKHGQIAYVFGFENLRESLEGKIKFNLLYIKLNRNG